jgi:hypothetical protein
MRKTLFLNLGKILFISFLVLSFVFQGNTKTFGQTTSDCASGYLLGGFSDKEVFSNNGNKIIGEVGVSLGELQVINENKTISNIVITALDPLPAGLSLAKKDVSYGSPIEGVKEWTRYYIKGTPTQAGTTKVRLKAESPTCGTDTGYVSIEIAPTGIYCNLKAVSPIKPGETSTLTWTLTGPVSGGSMSPALPSFADFSKEGSAVTSALNADTRFTLNISSSGQSNSCEVNITVGSSTGESLKFIKTLLNIPTIHNGGSQVITSAILASNKFVFGGDCGVDMTGTRAGGGIWIVPETGATIKERQACIDAGSGTNMIYQHANVHQDELHADASGGFVRENSSWASCIIAGTAGPGDCKQFGDGANRAVFYGASGNPVSTSPLYTYNTQLIALKNRVIALGTGGYGMGGSTLLGLPSWQVVTSLEDIRPTSVGFGDFLVSNGVLYSISRDGVMKELKKLSPDAVSDLGSAGFLGIYSYDNSTSPAKLALVVPNKTGTGDNVKIYVYRLYGRAVTLDKTIEMPGDVFKPVNNLVNSFGIWGQYVVTSGKNSGEIDVWKAGKKIETVKMQDGGYPWEIVISKGGYVAVTTMMNNSGKTAAYLYKLSGSPAGGGTTTGPIGPQTACQQKYPNNSSLAALCEQFNAILKSTCAAAPDIDLCIKQQAL